MILMNVILNNCIVQLVHTPHAMESVDISSRNHIGVA